MRHALLTLLAVLPLAGGCNRVEGPADAKPIADAEMTAVAVVPATPTPARLQRYWPLPEFDLIERSGRRVIRKDLEGKVWIASFFFTGCPGPCGTLNTRITGFRKALGADDRVRIVSITGDPERDHPRALTTYARRFFAGPNWYFLTGDKTAIWKLARDGFKLPIADDPKTPGLVTHSTRLVLIDRTGMVRGFYEGAGDSEEPIKELLFDLQTLLDERVVVR